MKEISECHLRPHKTRSVNSSARSHNRHSRRFCSIMTVRSLLFPSIVRALSRTPESFRCCKRSLTPGGLAWSSSQGVTHTISTPCSTFDRSRKCGDHTACNGCDPMAPSKCRSLTPKHCRLWKTRNAGFPIRGFITWQSRSRGVSQYTGAPWMRIRQFNCVEEFCWAGSPSQRAPH